MAYRELDKGAKTVQKKIEQSELGEIPETFVILGSGLGVLTEEMASKTIIPYRDVPGLVDSSVEGHEGQFVVGRLDDTPVLSMDGRVHYYEVGEMEPVVAPVRIAGMLGVEQMVVTNAAGGIDQSYNPGDLMLIDDHLNLMGTNPLIGSHTPEFGERFPDMTEPYSNSLIDKAYGLLQSSPLHTHVGVYAAMTGPSYETPAEIRMLETLGANAVGMSTVPETVVANQMDISTLGISTITNHAAGVTENPLSHEEVVETTEQIKPHLKNALTKIVNSI